MKVALPSWRVAARVPAVRAAVLLLLLGPLFVELGGPGEQAQLRLRVTAVAGAVALALLWEDRCATLVAATPVGLPAVRRGQALVVLLLLVASWGASSVVAARSAALPVAGLALEAAGLAVVLVALVGLLARGREGEPVAALAVPVLLGVVVALSRLPQRWSLINAPPGGPGWAAERGRWAVVLLVGVLVVSWCGRDLAARGLLSRQPVH